MSQTNTPTPTITLTPVPFPYVLKIEAYNEAGERVKLICEVRISENIGDLYMRINGKDSEVYDPYDMDINGNINPLEFIMPGLMTPDQLGGLEIKFAWDGSNDNGQALTNGLYYIKVSVKDEYGHLETTNREVQLLRSEEYVRINIFNSAGELVRRIEERKATAGRISLGIEDVMIIGKDNPDVIINYADGASMSWDGKNNEGKMVSSGVYEIQVEVKTSDGFKTEASKSVTILNESGNDALGEVKAYPNPYYVIPELNLPMTIAWANAGPGTVRVKIYNITGELVKEFKADRAAGSLSWNARSAGGASVASGVYVIYIEGQKDSGEREVKKVKAVLFKALTVDDGENLN
jgi:flagellar hook assembly protein FlgD